ncbi:hypothetical protein BDW74DRAFT_163130 [Aspergillus multicolor]|uniref:NIF domain protein n=1 Tax=Aspergillus multicolor TaxID=41759 RepID=UPI003CCD1F2F
MSRCGAYDKLVFSTLANNHRPPLNFRPRSLPVQKIPVAHASTNRYPLLPFAMKSQTSPNNPSGSDSQAGGKRLPNASAATSMTGWRPYNGRWDAKVAYRDNRNETTLDEAATYTNQAPQRGRSQQSQWTFSRNFNGPADVRGQSGRSYSPRRDAPSLQPPQLPNIPNPAMFPINNAPADYSMMNPFAVFNGFPMPTDPMAFQLPFFPPNMPDQSQSQFPPAFDPSLPNPTLFPLLGGGNPFITMPPFLPPFLNFDMMNQASLNPMLNTMDQMGTTTSTGFTASGPQQSEQRGSGGSKVDNAGATAVNSRRSKRKGSGGSKVDKEPSKPRRPPTATEVYLEQASKPPKELPSPQPMLVILDLNGTLIYRKTRKFPPSFARRPGLETFLKVLIEKYKVMIWSSSQPATVAAVCKQLFPGPMRKELAVEWGRDRLGLSKAEYNSKIQVYKTLNTVWSSKQVQGSHPNTCKRGKKKYVPRWDQTNTVLIDDSKTKAVSEPYNLIEIPEFTNDPSVDESNVFARVLQRLELLSRCDDVSRMLHKWTTANPETGVFDLDLGPVPPLPTLEEVEPASSPAVAPELTPFALKSTPASSLPHDTHLIPYQAQCLDLLPGTDQMERQLQAAASMDSESEEPYSPKFETRQPSSESSDLERSPSPASTVQSGNPLLDRLEESLN